MNWQSKDMHAVLQHRCSHRPYQCEFTQPEAIKEHINPAQDVCGLVRSGLSACFCAGPGWVWSLPLLPGARASRCSQVE
ncbi:hypothetical protein AMELA_G00231910 [Ameiurus melas]|uniref:Uncharacterized protein n=1 Tax=Ameiurus melas TaxID=219545 RepID=A0A7J5ZZ75_AMEME|nr:hypothetical protein AMELA_G00231910 [Ameiurus melas]